MKIMTKWLNLFKFSWLRKCKVCRVRGTKCLCKRPSLALEHIFFLEERKNKFGARNFSHVSDTMVTSSTLNSTNNTVLMRGSSFGDEYAFVDYYYNPSQQQQQNSITGASSSSAQRTSLTGSNGGRGSHSSRSSGSRSSLDMKRKGSSGTKRAAPATTTTIVRKNSGRMVPTGAARRRFEELPNEYTLYSDHTTSSIAKTTSTSLHGSSRRRPLRLQSGSSTNSSTSITARKEETATGCSFKFYGRGGHSSSVSTSASTFRSSRGALQSGRGFGSKNDSLVLSSSATSSLRMSTTSDRMSVDNNFGSYNPRGMYIEHGYTSSIQEDDDDATALQQLNGWLQASPTSTAGSFAAPRNIHCF